MSVGLLPVGNDAPYVDSNGDPLSGGLLYWYVANSSTPQDTYTTSAGNVANANPVVLNSSGYPSSGGNLVQIYGTEGVTYKAILKNSAGTTLWTRDNLSVTNDVAETSSEWISGAAPTYISATSFSLVGDQTTDYHVGRRLKTTNSGGTVYSTIVTSAYGALTTVTVVNDSGTLDSGLSAVYYGLLSATNPSTPLLADTYPIVSGSADKTKKLRLEVDGLTTATTRVLTLPDFDLTLFKPVATVAAHATTMDPWVASTISLSGGAVTFTDIADAPYAGATVWIRSNAAHIWTDGAVFNVQGDANYTTADGDWLRIYANSVSTFDVTIFPALGQPASMHPITNSLSGDVALNNTGNFFTGPTIAQGTAGTWFVSGTVSCADSAGAANFVAKLWDGTTVIASAQDQSNGANVPTAISLSGYISAPAGNLRISVKDTTATTGAIKADVSGAAKDSTITAIRIA